MIANPRFTWHFKQSMQRDVQATARPVTDEAERKQVFERMLELEERMSGMDVLGRTKHSPLVEVELQV